MAAILNRYFSLSLVLSILAPLWLAVIGAAQSEKSAAIHTALTWSGVLLAGWATLRFIRRYHVRGHWRAPTAEVRSFYLRLLVAVLLVDFGSKALFFRWDRPGQVDLLPNFGLHSVFHVTDFETFHVFLVLYFLFWFLLGPLFFRFAHGALDRLWLSSSALALGGALALSFERLLFGGVHNSFYFAGPLMWICPPCASPAFSSYAWTPADLFVHAAVVPLIVLLLSYLPSRQAKLARPT